MKKNYMWLLMLFVFSFSNAQEGTTCEDPIVIDALPFSVSDDTANYADNYDPQTTTHPVCSGGTNGNYYHGGNDVIYSYTPSADASVNFRLPNVVGWTGIFIYTDCANIGVEYAACSTSSAAGNREVNEFAVTAGQTYYILISTWPSPQTFAYTLNVTENTCTNGAATYTVVADCTEGEQFMVDVEVTDFGSAESMTVYDDQGSTPQMLTGVGVVTFGPYPNANPVVFTVANDQDETCVLTSPAMNQLACPPANDECSGAEELIVNPEYVCDSVTPSTLIGATGSVVDGNTCFGNPNDDIWYSFEATASSHRVSLLNVTPFADLYHSLWTGGCEGLTLVAGSCSDGNVSNPSGLIPGEIYYLRIYTYGAASSASTFNICIGTPPPPPVNDNCETAIDLTNETSPLMSTTEGATNTNLTVCNGSGEDVDNVHPDMYYSIVVPDGSTLTIGQTENNYDSANIVFYGDCDNRTTIACFDDADDTQVEWSNDTGSEQTVYWVQDGWSGAGTFTLEWSVIACTPAEATYTVVSDCENGEGFLVEVDVTNLGSAESISVYDDQGSEPQVLEEVGVVTFGPYPNDNPVIFSVVNDQDDNCTLTSPAMNQLVCPPVNDTCEGAIDLTNETSPLMATTVGATNTNATVCNNSEEEVANTQPDVYYSIVVPDGSMLTIGQTENSYDSANIVFYGDCDNRTSIACFDDADDTQVEWVNDTGSEQTVYWVQDGWSGAGTFTLEWSVIACTPSEATYTVVSDCENGEGFFVEVDVTNLGSATSVTVSDDQGSEPQVLEEAGVVTFGPYTNDTPVIFNVVNDQDDNCTLTSPAMNQVACPPANDECIDATVVVVDEQFCDGSNNNGSNLAATDSGVEEAECFNYGLNDVWFSFIVPEGTATVDISTDFLGGTLVDSEIALYSGTCDALVEEGCDQDGGIVTLSNGFSWNSIISDAPVTVGETYFVRVSGYGSGAVGDFCLDVSTNQTLSTIEFEKTNLTAYPNPVKDILNLSYTQNISNVEVFNVLGQQVLTKSVNATQDQIDMSNLAVGTYLIKVTADNQVKTIKVIKQ